MGGNDSKTIKSQEIWKIIITKFKICAVRHVVQGRMHGWWALFWTGVIRGLLLQNLDCKKSNGHAPWKTNSGIDFTTKLCISIYGEHCHFTVHTGISIDTNCFKLSSLAEVRSYKNLQLIVEILSIGHTLKGLLFPVRAKKTRRKQALLSA